jgi:uncharacterized Zn-finger protein
MAAHAHVTARSISFVPFTQLSATPLSPTTLNPICTWILNIFLLSGGLFVLVLVLQTIPYELQPMLCEERPYSFEVCNKSFRQQNILKTHQLIHSGERPFCCDVCNKSFSQQCNIQKHQRIHAGERPLCCDVCNKSFSQQCNLQKHQNIHTGERPFTCDVASVT